MNIIENFRQFNTCGYNYVCLAGLIKCNLHFGYSEREAIWQIAGKPTDIRQALCKQSLVFMGGSIGLLKPPPMPPLGMSTQQSPQEQGHNTRPIRFTTDAVGTTDRHKTVWIYCWREHEQANTSFPNEIHKRTWKKIRNTSSFFLAEP